MLDVSGPAYLDNEAFEYEHLRADIVLGRSRKVSALDDSADLTITASPENTSPPADDAVAVGDASSPPSDAKHADDFGDLK
jgi:hypothetical protein